MDSRLAGAAVAALALGLGLMVPFEATVTLALGVVFLIAFIVLGVFAIATPEYLAQNEDEE
jgi:hypothetical protein